MQISHSADTMAQSYECHSHLFHFLIPLPITSQQRQEPFLISNAESISCTAVNGVLFRGLVMAADFTRLGINNLSKL